MLSRAYRARLCLQERAPAPYAHSPAPLPRGRTGTQGLSHTNDPGGQRDGSGEHCPSSSYGCITSAELTGAKSTPSPQRQRASRAAQLGKGICGIRGRCALFDVWQQTGCAEGRWKAKFNTNQWKRHLGTKVLGLNTLWPYHCPPVHLLPFPSLDCAHFHYSGLWNRNGFQ